MFADPVVLFRIAADTLKTPPRRTPMDWAKLNRVLPPGSAEPGLYRPERVPFWIPVAEAFINPKYDRIIGVCGVQMSKTEFAIICIGYTVDDKPVPVIFVCPTQRLVESISDNRVGEMLRSTPQLWEKTAKGQRFKIGEKFVSGVRIGFAWASSASELSSHPAGVVFLDERDRMVNDVQGEGDPVEIAEGRTATYPDGKVVVISTPTIEGASPIWKLWEEGTQERWNIPCPSCEEFFWPSLSKLKWTYIKEESRVENVYLECPNCEHQIDDSHRVPLNAKGKYISTDPKKAESKTASFWISGLCSPWRSYEEAALAFASASETKQIEKIQAVVNTVFGETWKVQGEAPSIEELLELRCELDSRILPEETQMLTAHVDVQKDCLYYTVRAWGYRGESWTVERDILYCESTEKDDVWKDLEDYVLNNPWEFKGGVFRVRLMVIDSGYRPYHAYLLSKKYPGRVLALKGHQTQTSPVRSSKIEVNYQGKHIPGGVQLFHFDDFYFKSFLHSKIKRGNYQGSEAWHLPKNIDEEFCKQILAEQLVTKSSGGKLWVQTYQHNHFLDCEKMAEVAGHIANSIKFRKETEAEEKRKAYKVLNEGVKE